MTTNYTIDGKEEMRNLYRQEVEGTENLYLDIGYFMRMRFWDTLNDMSSEINSAHSFDECKKVYLYVMELMNRYIEDVDNKSTVENINNMIFNRNMIKRSYADEPMMFVEKLKECFQREQIILQNAVVQHTTNNNVPEVRHFLLPQKKEEEMDPASASLEQEEEDLDEMSADFDEAFMEKLQLIFNQMETSFNYKREIEIEYNRIIQNMAFHVEITSLENRRGPAEQKYRQDLNLLLQELQRSVSCLSAMREKYLYYQGRMEVKLLRMEKLEPRLSIIFDRFMGFLDKLFNTFSIRDSRLDAVIKSFMALCIVVKGQPPDFIFVDNEKKGEKSKDDKADNPSAGKGKAATKTYCTKKKESISTSLLILGYRKLSNVFIRNETITLVTEDGSPCGNLIYPNYVQDGGEVSYEDIKIHGYGRRCASNVNEQFVRLSFNLKICCFDLDFEITTKSLPFFLCTGAVQELELIGSRMWYIGSNDNMYNGECQLHDDLKLEKVMDILDQRVQSMGSSGCRGLSECAKEYLQNIIPGRKASKDSKKNITRHSLLKSKGKKGDKKPEEVFSFFTWFYALVHSIETYLLQPWNAGVIYDLMTKKEAEQVLLNDNIPPNTALIRPAKSFVLNPNCKAAQIKVAVEIKQRFDDDYEIHVVNLDMKYIKDYSLHGALESITDETNDSAVIKYVLMKNGSCVPLKEMMKYDPAVTPYFQYHYSIVQKFSTLKLQGSGKPSSKPGGKMAKHDQECHSYDQEGYSPRKRKISRQPSNSSMVRHPPLTSRSSSWLLENSPVSMTDSSPGMNRNDTRSPGASSSQSSSCFSPRDLKCLNSHELKDVKQEIIESTSQSPKQQQENWTPFRGVSVDVSAITGIVVNPQLTFPEMMNTTNERILIVNEGQTNHFSSCQNELTNLTSVSDAMINHVTPPCQDRSEDEIFRGVIEMQDSSLSHTHTMDINNIVEMLKNSSDIVQRSKTTHTMCH